MSGRLVCDMKVSSREFIKAVTYELTELAETQLQLQRGEVDPENIGQYYQ